MTTVEKQIKVNEALGNYMAEQLEKNMPVTAAFRGCGIQFEICDTKNQGLMKLEYHSPGKVYGQLGIYRKGTDRMCSNFIPAATADEMICYLRDPATHQEWLEQIQHLSCKVDNFWD